MKLAVLIAFLASCALALGHVVPPQVAFENIPEEVPVAVEDEAMTRSTGCVITVRTEKVEPQPLYLKSGTSTLYPINGQGQMDIEADGEIELYCPSKFAAPFATSTNIVAKCVSGTMLRVDTTDHEFSTFKCGSWPSYSARKTGGTCPGGVDVETGFVVGSRFVAINNLCFNEDIEATRYVHHTLIPGSDFYQTSIPRVTFATGGFFGGKNVDKLYTQVQQKETISGLLGYDASKYFDTANIFLARGHLDAKADHIMGSPQRGTFLFVNAGPQWQAFNAGNWQRVEDGVRTMVTKRQITVQCYTGTYGVTTLPDKDGKETELYLYVDGTTRQIPVPKIYFRIVYEETTKKAIVLIGVNNPHLTLEQIEKDYIFCPDISSKVTFVNWTKDSITKGYSYACEYSEFKKAVPNVPSLTVNEVFI